MTSYVLNTNEEGNMNKPAKIITSVAFSLLAQAAITGPFGLNTGMSIKKIDTKAKQAAPSVFTSIR